MKDSISKKIKISIYSITSLCSLKLFSAANAIDLIDSGDISNKTGLGTDGPIEVTATLVNGFLTVLGIIAVVLIIYGGFTWMFSRGNEEEVKKAIGILKAAAIGLIIVLASYGIAIYVFSILEGATGYK